jgi:hypothetical protein
MRGLIVITSYCRCCAKTVQMTRMIRSSRRSLDIFADDRATMISICVFCYPIDTESLEGPLDTWFSQL